MASSSSFPPLGDPQTFARRLLQRAHNRDGLPEIALGLTFLLSGILTYAQVVLPRQSIGFRAAVLSFVLLIPALCLGASPALRWVRQRYLIDRLGYVQSKPVSRKHIVIGLSVALVVTVVLSVVVTHFSQPDRWVLVTTGLGGGALLAWSGRLPRFVISGILMAAVGVALALSGVELQVGLAVLFASLGLLALISGCMVFLSFLRQPVEPGE